MSILVAIDNGHGINTPGKRCHDDDMREEGRAEERANTEREKANAEREKARAEALEARVCELEGIISNMQGENRKQ